MTDLLLTVVGTVLAGSMLWAAKLLSDLKAKVAAIQERLSAGANQMDRIEGRIDDHETRIRGLEQQR